VLRGSFDAVVRIRVRVLPELHIAREWIALLPVADVFAVAIAASTPRISVLSTDPDVGAAVGAAVSQRAAVHVGIPAPPVCYGYGDRNRDTESTSNPAGEL
jgi:hypothetical protein